MKTKISAYLQVFNDYSILPSVLASIQDLVDELVIVDGAYTWMQPYLHELNTSSSRSRDELYDAVEKSRIPYKSLTRVWNNQLEKRIAGYEACSNDHIMRVDADEIMLFDQSALSSALTSGAAVGDMQMPLYLTPGYVVNGSEHSEHPRQCFYFNRRLITAPVHLNYLWLVLEADKRPLDGMFPHPVYPVPLAFNAHLTNWRRLNLGLTRTLYYVTNWMRGNGVPWIPSLQGTGLSEFEKLFRFISPRNFVDLLETYAMSLGKFSLEEGETISVRSESVEFRAELDLLYFSFMESIIDLNKKIKSRRQPIIEGISCFLDVTSKESRDVIASSGSIVIVFEDKLESFSAHIHVLDPGGALQYRENLRVDRSDHRVDIPLPALLEGVYCRIVVEMVVQTDCPNPVSFFKIQ